MVLLVSYRRIAISSISFVSILDLTLCYRIFPPPGELFDVREFHMAVLENGAIPLPILEDQVLKWIKDYRKRKLEEEEMDGECECVMVPRAKPKVRCRRSSPLTLEPNAAHRLQAVYIMWVTFVSVIVTGFSVPLRSRLSLTS